MGYFKTSMKKIFFTLICLIYALKKFFEKKFNLSPLLINENSGMPPHKKVAKKDMKIAYNKVITLAASYSLLLLRLIALIKSPKEITPKKILYLNMYLPLPIPVQE